MNMRFVSFNATGTLVAKKNKLPTDRQLVDGSQYNFDGLHVTQDYLPAENLRAGAMEVVHLRDKVVKIWNLEGEKLVCYVFLGDNPRGLMHEYECIGYGVYRDKPRPDRKVHVVRLVDGPAGHA